MTNQLGFASCVLMAIVGLTMVSAVDAQTLDGVWEITAVIDDGRVDSAGRDPHQLRGRRAGDDQWAGGAVHFAEHVPAEAASLRGRRDPSPARLDLAGAEKTGGRGIVLPSKDSLILCLASRDHDRPASFSSQPGSGNLLITLNRATGDAPSTPTPGEAPKYTDDQLRQMLAGTWGHQDEETIHYLTFNADGSMNATMTWKDNFKKMFHQDVRSSGTWKVQDGVVLVKIDTSSDKERRGQQFSFRIRSINPTELVAVDAQGAVRQEWRAQ